MLLKMFYPHQRFSQPLRIISKHCTSNTKLGAKLIFQFLQLPPLIFTMKLIFTFLTSTSARRALLILRIHQNNNTLKILATTKLTRIVNRSAKEFNTISLSTIFTTTILRHNRYIGNKKDKTEGTHLGTSAL